MMRLRLIAFAIIAALTLITWRVSSRAVAFQSRSHAAAFVRSGYRKCVTIVPPPIGHSKKIVLYPHNSELS